MMTVVQVILLYGLLAGPYSGSHALPVAGFSQSEESRPLDESTSLIPASLFNALPSENQTSGFNIVPAPSPKDFTDDYRIHQRSIELLIVRLCSGYMLYAGNIVPGLPNTVIVFPFHDFW